VYYLLSHVKNDNGSNNDPIDDSLEILDWLFLHHLRIIKDPEHPLTLEELNVVEESHIKVSE